MTGLRVLIVDDERPAREKVRRFVESAPEVETIYEARDGLHALDVIREEAPDIVFLDIQMPEIDGIQVAESVAVDALPYIVFVTAYDEFALRAFDLHAVDYLLKPFDADRFDRAFARARAAAQGARQEDEVARLREVVRVLAENRAPWLDRVLADDGKRSRLVRLDQVAKLVAERNYVILHTAEGCARLRTTMTDLERRLEPSRFVRVNRSTIVNADYIDTLEPIGHGDYDLRLRVGSSVRLSRRYRDRLANWLP